MKLTTTVKKEVNIPIEKVYETILKWYYERAKNDSDGWCIFGSFRKFIECRYNMAINNEDPNMNWEKIDLRIQK